MSRHDGPLGQAEPPLFLIDALPAGDQITLAGDEARHAATVRRIRPGEALMIGDGAGSLARCTVAAVRTGRDAELDLTVTERRYSPTPQPRVIIAQALVKGDRGELAVELATEAGADAILPWRASRSIARWDDGPRGAKALARWRAAARSATKQARRPWLPDVHEPVSTASLAAAINDSAAALVLDGAATAGIGELKLPRDGDVIVVVGPEGGITGDEFETLTDSGAVTTRLGSSVLRASTAAAVALGALGVLTARWT